MYYVWSYLGPVLFCIPIVLQLHAKSKSTTFWKKKLEKRPENTSFEFELEFRFRVGPEVVDEFASQKEKIRNPEKNEISKL